MEEGFLLAGNVIVFLAVGFVIAGWVGIEIAKAAKRLQSVYEWEEENMTDGIVCSVELDRETYDWVWKKSAERGEGTRDFIKGLIEEARKEEGKGFRARES